MLLIRHQKGARELVPLLIDEQALGFSLDEQPELEVKEKELVFSANEETGESTTGQVEVTKTVRVDIVSQIINGCDKPDEYLSKFNDRSKDFYKDLNEILMPIDCNLEAHLLTNQTNIDTIKTLFSDGLNAINQYVSQEVVDLDSLTEPEKRSLAMIAIRLDEIGYQVGEHDAARTELGEVYKLSKSFLPQ